MRIRSKIKACVLACSLLGLSAASYAAGLGKMTVISGLGQPLNAEIDLVSVQEEEVATLSAKLASPEMFREAQLQYPSHLSGLRFAVEKRPSGQRYLKVQSSSPVNEPFIDVLVELNWNTGRLVKEFTALLDPLGEQSPKVDQSRVPQTQAVTGDAGNGKAGAIGSAAKAGKSYARKGARIGEPAIPESIKAAPKMEAKAAETPKPAAPAEAPKAESASASSYKVKPGESLASIAEKVKPDGVSLDQMLAGLYRANGDAFDGKNINRLKAGKILAVPDKSTVAAISKDDAVQEIKTHSSDWNAYRQKLAEAVTKAPGESQAKSSASGKISGKVEDKAAPPKAPSQEVVKLSKSEPAKGAKGAGGVESKALQDKIASMEEEATAREKSLKDANERIASLQKSIQDMQKLMDMRSKSGADMQASAQAGKQPAKPEEAAKPAPATPVETKSEAEKTASAPAPAPDATKPAEPVKPKSAHKPVAVPPPPAPEPSFLDSLLGNPLLLGGGAAALALGGGALLWTRRRKKPSFEDSILTGSDLKANTVLGNTGGAIINTNATESSFLTDFSRAGLGTIDTDEVDPIAEAEVYMAYGRDAQAEEILKDALAKDPTRQEIRLKLLEIYAARKNVSTFEDMASELYAESGGHGTMWAKAAEMGRQLDPTNPLYGHGPAAAEAAPSVDPFAKTQAMELPVTPAAQGLVSAAPAVEPAHPDVDFQLDLDEPAAPAAAADMEFDSSAATIDTNAVAPVLDAPVETSNLMDFDLGDFSIPEPEHKAAVVEAPLADGVAFASDEAVPLDLELTAPPLPALDEPAPQADSNLLDFDFQLDAPAAEAPKLDVAEAAVLDLGGIDLSLDEPVAAPEAVAEVPLDDAADPMATKIDLARAYLDMGDKEGAREILEEVIQEGNQEQQSAAKALLQQI